MLSSGCLRNWPDVIARTISRRNSVKNGSSFSKNCSSTPEIQSYVPLASKIRAVRQFDPCLVEETRDVLII